MTSTAIRVHTDLDGETVGVADAWVTQRRATCTTSFRYDPAWQVRTSGYPISPDLDLTEAAQQTDGLPGALADSAPDRWGRNLIQRQHRATARAADAAPRDLLEVDYLLGVSDLTRQGALRFTSGTDDRFLAPGTRVPKLIELPSLLHAVQAVTTDDDSFTAVKLLLDAGTGSLGGARPKASVRDDDGLAIAKFPHHHDEWDVMSWEKTALDLAERAGIRVPPSRLVPVDRSHALILRRFDRTASGRVGYISAMTLIDGADGESHDYLEIAEALAEHGSSVRKDLAELWRRVAFGLLVNNTDDHLRNHGFLRERSGWRLAPAFDLNPNPVQGTRSQTSIGFATGSRAEQLDALRDAASDFGLTPGDADSIVGEVVGAVRNWRQVAATNGVPQSQIARFADALDELLVP